MQIRRISILNMNSLRGLNELRFDEPPLKEAGLFAIMGPTGSGKSTLLDAICLALFNRVPRMPSAVSKNEIESKGSIVTHHCKEASAEVEYSCSAGTFISRWSIKMNRNGNWNDYQMELENKTEQQLEPLRRTDVPARNEALIGLNYDQFVKSMLLAQGDFARFLKSNVKDRVELLEKITNGEIYRKLGKMAFEKSKVYDEIQQQLKARITEEEKKMSPDSDFDAFKNSLAETEKNLQELDDKLQQQLQWQRDFRQLDQFTQELEALKRKWDDCIKVEQEFHQTNARVLQKQEALLPLEKQLDEFSVSMRELQGKQTAIQQLTLQQQQAEEQKNNLLFSLATFTKVDNGLEEKDVSDVLRQMKLRYGKLWEDITVKRTLISARIQYFKSNYGQLLSLNTNAVEESALQVDSKINELEQSIALLKDVLEEEESNNPQDAKSRLQFLKLKVQDWKQVNSDLVKIVQEVQQIAVDQREKQVELKRLGEEEQADFSAKQVLEKDLSIVRLEYQNMQLRMSLDEHRKLLTDGAPCPLCGSLHHPIARNSEGEELLNPLLLKAKELERKISQLTTAQQNRLLNINQCRNALTGLEIMLQNNQKIQTEKQVRLEELSLQVPALFREAESGYFDQRILQLTTFETQMSDLVQLHRLKQEWLEYGLMVKDGLSVQSALNEVYAGKDFEQRWSQLNTGWEVNRNDLTRLILEKEKAAVELTEIADRESAQETRLMLVLQPLGYNSVVDALENRLSMQDYQRLLNEKNKLEANKNQQKHLYELKQVDLHTLKEQLKNLDRLQVEQFVVTAATTKARLNEEKNRLVLVVDREMQYRLAADGFRQQLATNVEEGKNWQLMKEMIGDAQGSRFSGYAQQLTMKQLTLSANRRLEQLDRRYVLVAGDSQKQELQVIDRDMGNSIRSVETLSGGETFLMSLALALGLSDLASHKVELGSLFIDEGFGTLDPEVLEKTISMLEQLQMQDNKTIGIISHVEALKERIRVKVNVVKNGQGYSQVFV